MLTGALYVDMAFHDDPPPAKMNWDSKYPVFPTVPKSSEELLGAVKKFAHKLEAFPVEKIGNDLRAVVDNLKKTTEQISTAEIEAVLKNVKTLTDNLNQTVQDAGVFINDLNTGRGGEVVATLTQAQKTLASLEEALGSDSNLNQETIRALREVADAASSIRMLVDFLERQPSSLIYGKGENK
jgi:paraquat-inducible protein B